jgi:hypothetical protein
MKGQGYPSSGRHESSRTPVLRPLSESRRVYCSVDSFEHRRHNRTSVSAAAEVLEVTATQHVIAVATS